MVTLVRIPTGQTMKRNVSQDEMMSETETENISEEETTNKETVTRVEVHPDLKAAVQ